MKYFNYFLLLVAVVLTFVALYFWLSKGQIDVAVLCFVFALGSHSVYLHATKADKPG
jgi:hypothetical protein